MAGRNASFNDYVMINKEMIIKGMIIVMGMARGMVIVMAIEMGMGMAMAMGGFNYSASGD